MKFRENDTAEMTASTERGHTVGRKGGPVVVAVLPRAGLGNVLFVWAKAMLYAHLNGLPLHTIGWGRVKIGPWLRGEKSKRYYGHFFKSDTTAFRRWRLGSRLKNARKISNPAVEVVQAGSLAGVGFVVFDEVPSWADFFEGIKEHRELVRQRLFEMLRPAMLEKLAQAEAPVVGVHVRLGDFKKLKPTENFRETGGVRTPQEYFIEMITKIREIKGDTLPVTIFTDGKPEEIGDILDLPDVRIAPDNPDIVHLLQLSQSKVVVTSASSTFGYWSGFLADAPLLIHPDHVHASLRSPAFNQKYFEGPLLEPTPPLLVNNIKRI